MSQSLDRGLVLLTEIAGGTMALGKLAETLGVHKSTALRLLRSLEEQHFVIRDENHRYRLGRRVFDLANQALEQRDVRSVAAPFLRAYNEKCGHTVHLVSYEAGEAVYIDAYESKHMVRMYSRVGDTAPLHCTAVGKVLVAYRPIDERRRLIADLELPMRTSNTITSTDAYHAEITRVRAQGYALDRGEREEIVHGVGVPVRDGSGEVSCAISVSVPVPVLGSDGIEAYLTDLLATADAISAAWSGTAPHSPR